LLLEKPRLKVTRSLLLWAELEGDVATTESRVAHHADCPNQTAATELMLARTLIGEGLY